MLAFKERISIPINGIRLDSELVIPEDAHGLVIFSHGSGSSSQSPRNAFVAGRLHEARMATLLFDLLTEEEDQKQDNRFDIELLSQRLAKTTQWVSQLNEVHRLPLAFFGASTGAASAIKAAARLGEKIKALVSRGGRPDLAMDEISQLTTPSLFIVGGEDQAVLPQNEEAINRLQAPKKLEIVVGAGHLFEEPGTLEEVAKLTVQWFEKHLKP